MIGPLKQDEFVAPSRRASHAGPEGHDVPWGTGASEIEQFIKEIHRLGVKPTLFGLEYSYDWLDSMPEMADCIEFFDDLSLRLAE